MRSGRGSYLEGGGGLEVWAGEPQVEMGPRIVGKAAGRSGGLAR